MKQDSHKNAWLVGGTSLIGSGVGFILLERSALFFIASVLIGVGTGLVLAWFRPGDGKQ